MERKQKLAKLIEIEAEELNSAQTTEQMLILSQEVIRDAVELAKIILEESNKAS